MYIICKYVSLVCTLIPREGVDRVNKSYLILSYLQVPQWRYISSVVLHTHTCTITSTYLVHSSQCVSLLTAESSVKVMDVFLRSQVWSVSLKSNEAQSKLSSWKHKRAQDSALAATIWYWCATWNHWSILRPIEVLQWRFWVIRK